MADETPEEQRQPSQADLENIIRQQQALQQKQNQEKEEPKPTLFQSLTSELSDLVGASFNTAVGVAAPFAHNYFFPGTFRDAVTLSAATIAGNATTSHRRGKKYTSRDFVNSSLLGTAITMPLNYAFGFINDIPTTDALSVATKIGAWGGLIYPAFFPFYQFVDYVLTNRKLSGVFDYIKKEFWPALKTGWKTVFPISLLNVFFAPSWLQIPVAAALDYAVTLFGAPKRGDVPEDQKRDPRSFYQTTSKVINTAGTNVYNGFSESLYSLGYSLRSLYDSAPKPTPPAPKSAPEKPSTPATPEKEPSTA